jgi:hypothetical protein
MALDWINKYLALLYCYFCMANAYWNMARGNGSSDLCCGCMASCYTHLGPENRSVPLYSKSTKVISSVLYTLLFLRPQNVFSTHRMPSHVSRLKYWHYCVLRLCPCSRSFIRMRLRKSAQHCFHLWHATRGSCPNCEISRSKTHRTFPSIWRNLRHQCLITYRVLSVVIKSLAEQPSSHFLYHKV